MSVIIVPDPHIGKGLSIGKPGIGSALNSRIIDQINIFEWILIQAIEKLVSDIILTGDIFEEVKPGITIIALFISWLKKCTDHNINVHIIVGNHDILRSGQFYTSALDIVEAADIDSVYIYNRIGTLHLKGASFTLVPFRDRRSFNTNSNAEALDLLKNKFKYELAEIERDNIKVMVGHLAIEGSIPVGDEIDDITNELFCPIDMFVGYEYVFMGHIHTPQIMSKSPFVAHLGSMDISNFSEQNQKKYILLFDPKEVVPYNYIEIPTRSLKQISISVPDNIVDTTNYVINEIKEKHNSLKSAILRLNISFESPDLQNIDRIKVETCLNDLGAFYIAKISEEKKVVLVKKDNALQNMDSTINEAIAIGLFAKMNIDENIRSEFISIANNVVKECTQ